MWLTPMRRLAGARNNGLYARTGRWTAIPSRSRSGPIHYQIVEPLQSIRIWLEPNEAQAIAFDIVFRAVAPCVVEDSEDRRDSHGYRRQTDLAFAGTGYRFESVQGGIEYPDGQRELITGLVPKLRFNPINKRLIAGEFVFTMAMKANITACGGASYILRGITTAIAVTVPLSPNAINSVTA